jgi:hypothetical protein
MYYTITQPMGATLSIAWVLLVLNNVDTSQDTDLHIQFVHLFEDDKLN